MAGLVHARTLNALVKKGLIEVERYETSDWTYRKAGFNWKKVHTRKVRQWVKLVEKEGENE